MQIVKTLGFEQKVSSQLIAAAGFTCSTYPDGRQANAALLSAFTGNVRYRDDGTPPTGTVGVRIASGINPWLYQGDMQKFRAILEGGNPTLEITYVVVVD